MQGSELARMIKIARFKRGLTQRGLAKESGVAHSTIYLLESTGKCSDVTLFKVCRVLDVNFEEILKEKGE